MQPLVSSSDDEIKGNFPPSDHPPPTIEQTELQLRQKYIEIHPDPSWADSDEEQDSDEEPDPWKEQTDPNESKKTHNKNSYIPITRTTGKSSRIKNSFILPKDTLDLKPLGYVQTGKHATKSAAVQSLGFLFSNDLASKNPVLFTASLDHRLRFYTINESTNPLIHSIYFKDLMLTSAVVVPKSNNIICSGRRRHFYIVDPEKPESPLRVTNPGWNKYSRFHKTEPVKSLEKCFVHPNGNLVGFPHPSSNSVLLFDLRTRGHVGCVTTPEDKPTQCSFIQNQDNVHYDILCGGVNGIVHRFDIRNTKQIKEIHGFRDYGTVSISSMASSITHTAIGSKNGYLNLYSNDMISKHPTTLQGKNHSAYSELSPMKSFGNLVKKITSCTFNHDGKILAYASDEQDKHFRLVHVASQTIFTNFPSPKTPLGYVTGIEFSPMSQYLAISNTKGKTLLYRCGFYSM